eukprot:scaffold10921_cov181-Ochromonas_danica.AAC.1
MTASPQEDKIKEFITRQESARRPVVCITSGGTQVPLEQNMVRFLENFSRGERGALSAEYFLSRGYAVIFLHRQDSKLPFTKVFSKVVGSRLSHEVTTRLYAVQGDQVGLSVDPKFQSLLVAESALCQAVLGSDVYLEVDFVTLHEYLHLLEVLAKLLAPLGPRVLFYLAAAVSDFFIPPNQLSQHKIQSSRELNLELSQVPKLLGVLRNTWAPHAFVVSFKLETDANILLEKAYRAIDNYNVHLVIANLLQTRRDECILVSKELGEKDVDLPSEAYVKIPVRRDTDQPHLEEKLVTAVERAHIGHLLHEYGIFAENKSLVDQANVEMEVLQLLSDALSAPLAEEVKTYISMADEVWAELTSDDAIHSPPPPCRASKGDWLVLTSRVLIFAALASGLRFFSSIQQH